MKLWVALMGLLCVAAAGVVATADDSWPPQRYQAAADTATITFTDQAAVDQVCGKAPRGWTTRGCAINGTVTMQHPCSPQYQKADDSFARLVCHELGHTHGWTADHPR